MHVIGYGICTKGEANRYLKHTLDDFNRLCDDTIILLNNAGKAEKDMIASYGFHIVEDNREWGKHQWRIKENFVTHHVSQFNPDVTVCMDMDEKFVNLNREDIEQLDPRDAYYVYIVNLWNDGYKSNWSFWNVRIWGWHRELEEFYNFERRPLHCGLSPRWCYHLNKHAPFVLEHYGLKEKKDRDKKVKRYQKYDPQQQYREPAYYATLKSNESESYDRDEIVRLVNEDVARFPQPDGKLLPTQKGRKKVLVKRLYDGFTFDVDEKQLPNQLKQTYKGKGFIQV